MKIPRVYTEQVLASNAAIFLEEGPARHLTQVLRLKSGSPVILFNGDGFDYSGEITEQNKKAVQVSIAERGEREQPSCLSIHLGQGISKGERMDYAIQKAVELGVTEITPLITERCVVRISEQRMENRISHWQKIIISACEQSGRRILPVLHHPMSFNEWINRQDHDVSLLLDHRSAQVLTDIQQPVNSISITVGPEGGLTDDERASALAAGFQGIRLGPRVLRTETAPLAAIAAIQMVWGDFR